MPARLVFITGSKAGTAFDLGEGLTTVGRASDRGLRFLENEVLVSARHATIAYHDGRYVLRDDGSRNGTFVNADPVTGERVLTHGDLVQFGPGGPAARFLFETMPGATATLDPEEMRRALELIELTRRRAAGVVRATAAADPALVTTRELATMTYRRARRWGRGLVVLAAVLVLGTIGAVLWQQRSRARVERALAELSLALASERSSRVALEQSLASVGARYDSLRMAVESAQRSVARDPRLDLQTVREYSRGVALVVFSYGYGNRDRLLRYAVDERGEVITRAGPGGAVVPAITLGGGGPAVQRDGTATAFLVDSAGWMVTNRHVARPWEDDPDLDAIRALGFDVAGRILDLRVFFPPGDRSAPAVVETVSERADVAVLRVLGGRVSAPVLPLGAPADRARPGDPLIFIGYPTGPFNLLFRVNQAERAALLQRVGDDQRRLIEELARRRLIQPLITNGSVSDTTGSEVIHTATTTVGGSGGPLIDAQQRVVAVHYAFLRSPTPGDPFRTQRGVPVAFAWEILPPAVRRSLSLRDGDATR